MLPDLEMLVADLPEWANDDSYLELSPIKAIAEMVRLNVVAIHNWPARSLFEVDLKSAANTGTLAALLGVLQTSTDWRDWTRATLCSFAEIRQAVKYPGSAETLFPMLVEHSGLKVTQALLRFPAAELPRLVYLLSNTMGTAICKAYASCSDEMETIPLEWEPPVIWPEWPVPTPGAFGLASHADDEDWMHSDVLYSIHPFPHHDRYPEWAYFRRATGIDDPALSDLRGCIDFIQPTPSIEAAARCYRLEPTQRSESIVISDEEDGPAAALLQYDLTVDLDARTAALHIGRLSAFAHNGIDVEDFKNASIAILVRLLEYDMAEFRKILAPDEALPIKVSAGPATSPDLLQRIAEGIQFITDDDGQWESYGFDIKAQAVKPAPIRIGASTR